MEDHFMLTKYIPLDSITKIDAIVKEYKDRSSVPSVNHLRIIYDWIKSGEILCYAEKRMKEEFNVSLLNIRPRDSQTKYSAFSNPQTAGLQSNSAVVTQKKRSNSTKKKKRKKHNDTWNYRPGIINNSSNNNAIYKEFEYGLSDW